MTKPLNQCKILLVDDIRENINVLVQALKDDYKLGVALDGKTAIEFARKQKPDLILLDIMMPEMDGYEVARHLQSDPGTREIPFMFITAIDELENKTKGFEYGAVDYITKPFEIMEVKARVKTHLSLVTARQEIARQNKQMKHSLSLAMEVQQNLIPSCCPRLSGFDIAGKITYCDETGGDYFDYFPLHLPDNNALNRSDHLESDTPFPVHPVAPLGIAVGDVSDHGIPSALLMTTARAILRHRAGLPGNGVDILTDLNRQFVRDVRESGRFMTLFFCSLSGADRTISWVRAGHEPAMLFSPDSGQFELLTGKGAALGLSADTRFEEQQIRLTPGQVVLIYTDGITEAGNGTDEFFGKERIQSVIQAHAAEPAASILEALFERLNTFRGDKDLQDDLTAVIIKSV